MSHCLAASRPWCESPLRRVRPVPCLAFCALLSAALPAAVTAQGPSDKAEFFAALGEFSLAIEGRDGDDGARLAASLDSMEATLADWDAAIQEHERTLAAESGGADTATAVRARFALAGEYLDRGLPARAVALLQELRGMAPSATGVPLLLALTFDQLLDQPARATEPLRAVSDAAPDDPIAAYVLARNLVETGDDDGVAEVWRRFEQASAGGRRVTQAPFIRLGLFPETPGAQPFLPPAAYADGFAQLRQGNLLGAIASFRDALALDPLTTDPPGAAGGPRARAVAAIRDGLAGQARVLLQEAIAMTPDSPEAHRALGLVEIADRRYAEAADALRAAVRLNPDDERGRLSLGWSLTAAGEVDEAIEVLRETLEHMPASARAHLALADLLTRRRALDDAVRELEATLALGPLLGVNTIYDTIGDLRHDQQDRGGAAEAYASRAALTPNDPEAHQELGEAYVDLGRHREALAEFRVVTMLAPARAEAYSAMAQVYLREQRYEEAAAAALEAIRLDAADRQARYSYATALLRLGRRDEGERELEIYRALLDDAAERNQRDFELGTLRREASIATARGDHDRAADLLRQALELSPDAARSHLDLGLALLAAGRAGESLEQLDAAAELGAPVDVYLYIAEAYSALGREDDAERARAEYTRLRRQAIRESR